MNPLFEEAQSRMTAKDYEAAAQLFEQVIAHASTPATADAQIHGKAAMAISYALARLGRYTKALSFLKSAITALKKTEHTDLLLKLGNRAGNMYSILRQPDKAARQYEQVLQQAIQCNNTAEQILALLHLCWVLRSTGKMEEAIASGQKAMALLPTASTPLMEARAHSTVGSLCAETGNDDLAIEHFMRAHDHYQSINHVPEMCHQLDNIAECFANREMWKKAEEYRLRAYRSRQAVINPYIHAVNNLLLARHYTLTGHFSTARQYLDTAHQMIAGSLQQLDCELQRELALWHQCQGQWEEALRHARLHLQLATLQNNLHEMAIASLCLAECLAATRKYSTAEKHFAKALRFSQHQQSLHLREKAHQAWADLCTARGEHRKALQHYKHYIACREERISISSNHRMLLLEAHFDLESRNREIADLRHKINEQAPAKATNYKLSPREKETLKMLVHGLSYKLMADKQKVNYETVRTHIKRLYKKLGVATNTEAVAKAVKEGLV